MNSLSFSRSIESVSAGDDLSSLKANLAVNSAASEICRLSVGDVLEKAESKARVI